MSAKIFAPAEARLLDIWDYTRNTWGEEQADHYLHSLIGRIHLLEHQRHLWRLVAERKLPGIWFIRHEHHYIFFRELPSGSICVITVLHEHMDLPARLREDANSPEEGPA